MGMKRTFRTEADVKAAVKTLLESLGVWYFMPVRAGMFGVNGIPDFVCCYQGQFFGIETKFGKNTLSAHQKRQAAAIREHGGRFFTVTEQDFSDGGDALAANITGANSLHNSEEGYVR